jgi:hypothetical protein
MNAMREVKDMLKSIDILIGLSVVMLVASMAVTVMTGFFTHIGNTSGRNLRQGIADLLKLINPNFADDMVKKIASAVLTHPLIRAKKGRMGTVIHREELTKLLIGFAAGEEPATLDPSTQDALKKTLADHDIKDPSQTLKNIRELALQLERSSPELSNMARANLAILHEAESGFVAKINAWFDQTMDRVSQRFTMSTRVITFACGLALALVLQLDTVALVNRISVDDALQKSLMEQAQQISSQPKPDSAQSGNLYGSVIDQGVISIPNYPHDLKRLGDLRHLTGILVTALLLSLGAPFWYNSLKQLLQLRSKVAQQDDIQRKERQSTQGVVDTPAGPAPVTAGILSGERGDMAAAG